MNSLNNDLFYSNYVYPPTAQQLITKCNQELWYGYILFHFYEIALVGNVLIFSCINNFIY